MTKGVRKAWPVVFAIGHSARTRDAFLGMLQARGVQRVVDARTVPRSRRNPQFNRDRLPEALAEPGIGYVHRAGLGGLRRPKPNSPNSAWRNASVRGFADYKQTPEFAATLKALIELAAQGRVAPMCAEAVPWRCNRSLIGDGLAVRGLRVEHIVGATRAQPHALIPWARVRETRVAYPAEAGSRGGRAGTVRRVQRVDR